jgi:peptide/nickel transport system permease protein
MRFLWLTLIIVISLTVGASAIAPYDPLRTFPEHVTEAPNSSFLLGTDALGRDVLSRVLYGGRRTLMIATAATTMAVSFGFILGIIAGMSSGLMERIVETLINSVLAIPTLVIALSILTLTGQGWGQVAAAIGVAQIAIFAQFTRSATRTIRSADYVEGARAIGAGWYWRIRYHITPNIMPTLLAFAGVIFSYSILNSAALSFLGLGGSLAEPEWGVMLADGRSAFRIAPWIAIAPGVAITVTIIIVNRLVDGITRPHS